MKIEKKKTQQQQQQQQKTKQKQNKLITQYYYVTYYEYNTNFSKLKKNHSTKYNAKITSLETIWA